MYEQDPTEGAWIMANLTISNDENFEINFNYDDFGNFDKRAQSPNNLT